MKEILLLRHGQVDAPGYIGCRSNPSLSAEGAARSEELINGVIPAFQPDAIYASPLKRSLETIGPWAEEAILCEALRELDFGLWEGLTYQEIETAWSRELDLWIRDYVYSPPPKGESLEQMHQRVTGWWDRVILPGKDGRILAVTHAGPIRCLLSHISTRGVEHHWKFSVQRGNFCRITIYDDHRTVIMQTNVRDL